jgi:hypothetical protein
MSRKYRLQRHSAVAALFIIKRLHIEKKDMKKRKNLSAKQTVIITVTEN